MMVELVIYLVLIFFPVLVWGVFEKSGRKGWLTLVPFYNYFVWIKVVGKKWWWFILWLIPYINTFMVFLLVWETAKSFGKNKIWEILLATIVPFVYMPYLGFGSAKYYSLATRPAIKRSSGREWFDAIYWAVVAAFIIRTFIFEAYTIPTSSMEKSLLVGDFLVVSKTSYGARVPMTPLAIPFVHHTMPLTAFTKSYSELLKLPYHRFPGFCNVERNEPVVFNYPSGDTVVLERQNEDYYGIVRDQEMMMRQELGWKYKEGMGRDFIWKNYTVTARPLDKRENYVKRCVGVPGDTIMSINQQLYINGQKAENPNEMQFNYIVESKVPLSDRTLEKLGVSDEDKDMYRSYRVLPLTAEKRKMLEDMSFQKRIQPLIEEDGYFNYRIFPHDTAFVWNVDNFGPLYLPKAGDRVELTKNNIALYRRAIEVYEGNKLDVKGDRVYINGKPVTDYEFKQGYYWMMGDNRHNSADSRYWGYVPEDHILGKPLLVWLSLDKDKSLSDGKIRWNRIFKVIK